MPWGKSNHATGEYILGDETFLRYNSKLPIVVYAPKDVELYYVIWHQNDIINSAKEG